MEFKSWLEAKETALHVSGHDSSHRVRDGAVTRAFGRSLEAHMALAL